MTTFNPLERDIDRRALLRYGAAGAGAIATSTVLASCGSDPQTEAPTEVEASGVEGVEQVQLGEEITEGILYPDGYVGPRAYAREPFYTGDATFTIGTKLNPNDVGDWNTNEFTRWMEEQTGVPVTYDVVLNEDADLTRVNAQMTAGDMPDAYLMIPFTNDQVSLYGSQGLFQPLEDLIETYAPALRQVMEDYPEWGAALTATDGHKYQMAVPNDCYHCRVSPSRAFINERYLEAVGAEMPQTTEDLREVLKLFKEQDPSGTGQMIPFSGGGPNDFIDNFIMNSFLYNPGSEGTGGGWLRLNEGQVEFVADKDEWREGLRYLRTLSDDGTLDRSAFTMTSDELLQAGNQGRLGFVRSYYWGFFADIADEPDALWRDYVSVPPLEGPNGVRYANWNWETDRSRPFVITSNCENPEVLVQWLDYMFTLEGTLRAAAGNTENWNYAEEGDVGINGKQAIWDRVTWPPPAGTSLGGLALAYNSNDFRLGQLSDPDNPDLEVALYNATTEYEPYQEPREFFLPSLIFDETQASRRADIATSIESHVRQHMASFAIGEIDINDDAAWEEYVSAFQAMGLPEYLDLHQQAFDARQG
ncbi:extracellular solute-binding protein [Ruania alba]|uniref:Putative aldouronate transport system substrate-binding protein n=1 Tax=Ruania alba TaxID=648782 RepID=A0A1H5KUN7_9MICO|nr:extracellular solute-binding protein [Ruania alba]SEE67668.1 putative aldouronate transport system substrate-binding protein [Ruania alba]